MRKNMDTRFSFLVFIFLEKSFMKKESVFAKIIFFIKNH